MYGLVIIYLITLGKGNFYEQLKLDSYLKRQKLQKSTEAFCPIK
jgi:hypothetical protein